MEKLEDLIMIAVTERELMTRAETLDLLERTSGGSFDVFLRRNNIVPVHECKGKKYYFRPGIERIAIEENIAIQKEVIENISSLLKKFAKEIEKIEGQLSILSWSVSRDIFNGL